MNPSRERSIHCEMLGRPKVPETRPWFDESVTPLVDSIINLPFEEAAINSSVFPTEFFRRKYLYENSLATPSLHTA